DEMRKLPWGTTHRHHPHASSFKKSNRRGRTSSRKRSLTPKQYAASQSRSRGQNMARADARTYLKQRTAITCQLYQHQSVSCGQSAENRQKHARLQLKQTTNHRSPNTNVKRNRSPNGGRI